MKITKPPRVADVVFINDGKVLLVQQRKESAHGLWGFPGGHIEEDETPEEAAVREVQEEIGVDLVSLCFLKMCPITTARGPLNIHVYTGEFSGSIKLNNEELMAYKWFSVDELENMKESLRGECIIEQVGDALSRALL